MTGKDYRPVEKDGLLFLQPQWPVPEQVRAWVSSRRDRGSTPLPQGYGDFNLARHVDDDGDQVNLNRRRLIEVLELPAEPAWLQQVHGNAVIHTRDYRPGVEADACITRGPGAVAVVMTADCLPVLLAHPGDHACETLVAAVHAGWRGLAGGVLEAVLASLEAEGAVPAQTVAWLGPAIGVDHFQVGEEVKAAFTAIDPMADACFRISPDGGYMADLYGLARLRLKAAGINHIYGGDFCTMCDAGRYYSYRRYRNTGRFASLIYVD